MRHKKLVWLIQAGEVACGLTSADAQARLRNKLMFHLPGQHDQATHGGVGSNSGVAATSPLFERMRTLIDTDPGLRDAANALKTAKIGLEKDLRAARADGDSFGIKEIERRIVEHAVQELDFKRKLAALARL